MRPARPLHRAALVGLVSTFVAASAAAAAGPVRTAGSVRTAAATGFAVSSPAVRDGGALPVRFTCDGAAANPSVQWTAGPKGTRSYAVVMHHVAGPDDVHWYWVVYGIPSTVRSLAEGSAKVGTYGTNSVNGQRAYAPPCSKGPGAKAYTITAYALSKAPSFPAGTKVTRDVLLAAIAKTTLASSAMTVTYERPAGATAGGATGGSAGAGAGAGSRTTPAAAGTVTGAVYADNWFQLYVDGTLVATDPTPFKPFDVVPVSFPATYPMTIAIVAKDYADPATGLEYDNTRTGDGGLIARFSNGVTTSTSWRTLVVSRGPLNLAACLARPADCRVEDVAVPEGWTSPSFDDSTWTAASVFTRQDVQPHADDFDRYDWSGASFVWGKDLVLDNTVLFRTTIARP